MQELYIKSKAEDQDLTDKALKGIEKGLDIIGDVRASCKDKEINQIIIMQVQMQDIILPLQDCLMLAGIARKTYGARRDIYQLRTVLDRPDVKREGVIVEFV